ncbi:hypothetical protein [Xenorhabdus hominickii]|nr:hypothetical protein [Xenorhabdus hominickii]
MHKHRLFFLRAKLVEWHYPERRKTRFSGFIIKRDAGTVLA